LGPLEPARLRFTEGGGDEFTAYALSPSLGGDEYHLHNRDFARARASRRYQGHAYKLAA
jgi:hypothetical protein